MKNSTTYIVPGCGQRTQDYDLLIGMLKEKKQEVVAVEINWESNSFGKYVEQGKTQLAGTTSTDTIIGFSYGGNIALQSESPARKIMCSTPDIKNKNKRLIFDVLTQDRGIILNWNEVDSLDLRTEVDGKDFFVAGAKERMYANFAREFAENLRTGLKIIEGAAHNINGLEYVKGLEEFF
ncbi:MAG TPA: hypothetical protein VHA12_01760 [Candidatus Nanoarchaeia archaeon]|nr:hypothetical protein [Candidatus Nanoarchaeia archaeon]